MSCFTFNRLNFGSPLAAHPRAGVEAFRLYPCSVVLRNGLSNALERRDKRHLPPHGNQLREGWFWFALLPDAQTAFNALQSGEIDFVEVSPFDLCRCWPPTRN